MKILIFGGNGWIGNQFVEILKKQNVEFKIGKSRVDNEKLLSDEIEEYEPTHIISFIGRTHGKINNKVYSTIDYLEQKGKLYENIRDNLFSPILLSEICKKTFFKTRRISKDQVCIYKFHKLDKNNFSKRLLFLC